MAFPTKMYFSLSEVSARWHRQTKDVEYCIENGLLNAHIKVCSVKLTSNMLLNKFPHNSQEIYEYTGCKRIVYFTGEFNSDALTFDNSFTVDVITEKLREKSIFIKKTQA